MHPGAASHQDLKFVKELYQSLELDGPSLPRGTKRTVPAPLTYTMPGGGVLAPVIGEQKRLAGERKRERLDGDRVVERRRSGGGAE